MNVQCEPTIPILSLPLFLLSSNASLMIILHDNCRLVSRFEKRSRVKSQGPARVRMIARQVHAWPHGHGWTVRQEALSRFIHPGRGCHARSVDAVESIRSHIRSVRYESRHHIRSRLPHVPIALSSSSPDPIRTVHMSATEIEETPLVIPVVVTYRQQWKPASVSEQRALPSCA